MTDFQCFPLNSFKYFLTLFSKFFSSFLHSTCSLSDSHSYLALEDVYLPFRAALPNNPTLRRFPFATPMPCTGLSPSMASESSELVHQRDLCPPLEVTIRTAKPHDFNFELLPLHSQLLRQSLLVSFPPLSNMLKFSGYSCLPQVFTSS